MRLIATTVVRESIKGKQHTGYIYDVDWDARLVTRRIPVPDPSFPESDDNPRGGVRGGRGVAVLPQGPLVANYDTLLFYDSNWELQRSVSHPLFVGLHEIDWDGEHVWLTATAIDAILKVGLDGTTEVAWDPHTGEIASTMGLRGRRHPLDGSVDYRVREAPLVDDCHINCVSHHDNFMVINCGLVAPRASLGARLAQRALPRRGGGAQGDGQHQGTSAVVRVSAGRSETLVELGNVDFPNHNGQLLDSDRVVVCDSTRNMLRVFSAQDGMQLQSVSVPGRWLRGLQPVSATHVFAGSAPAAIVSIDLEQGEIADHVQLSEDPNEAVHGLTMVP